LISAHDDHIRFDGTDMEVELTVRLKHPVDTPGECTLPAKKLLDICPSSRGSDRDRRRG
jgi:DNA polymerase-3 subunit beta